MAALKLTLSRYFFSSIDSIQYTAITNTMSMAMAWTEQLNKGKRRTAVCKYSLRRPDIESLHSITEFAAGAQDSVQSLTCFAGKYIKNIAGVNVSVL